MCQGCVDAINDILPKEWTWDEKMTVAWNFTAFPFCPSETFREQLAEFMETAKAENHGATQDVVSKINHDGADMDEDN